MDINVSGQSLYGKDYTTAFDLEIQQKQSKLENYVTTIDAGAGAEKRQLVVRYGEVGLTEIQGSTDDVTFSDISTAQRWITGKAYDVATPHNIFTQGPLTKQRITDAIVQVQMAAVKRHRDETILSALFGATLSGTDGTSSVSYDSNNTIAADVGASANTGLNLKKWEKLKEKMDYNEVDDELISEHGGAVAILTEKSMVDLRQMVETFNEDYMSAYAVTRDARGNIKSFYGFDIVYFSTQRLAKFTTSSRLLNGSLRRIPVFTKKAIQLCRWHGDLTEVRDMPEKKGKVYNFYSALHYGAARVDEKLVYDIQVTE